MPIPAFDRRPRLARQGFEIAPLGLGGGPGHATDTGPCPGNRPVGRDRGHAVELLEPADETAVDDRNAVDEQQIGKPERSRLLVVDRQIVVGMRRAVRLHDEPPSAEIEVESSETRTVGGTTSLPSAAAPRVSRSRRR